ncbi:MAG TPA: phage portal protein [Luteibaculaceae bacterium]|nr:phage portal protein [Luteibaculaceae bacterium]
MGLVESFYRIFNRVNNHYSVSFGTNKTWDYQRIQKDAAAQSFLMNDALYSVVDRISTVTSQLPWKAMLGDVEVTNKSDEYLNLMWEPAAGMSRESWYYLASLYWRVFGEVIIVPEKKSIGFNDLELKLLPPYWVTPHYYADNNPLSGIKIYQVSAYGLSKQYTSDEVIHVKKQDPYLEDLYSQMGLSPLQSAQYLIQSNNNLQVAEANIFENRGANIIVSGSSDLGLNPQDRVRLDEAFKARVGGARNFNKAIISSTPITVNKMDMSPSDLKLLEAYTMHLRRICTIYSVPAEIFNAENAGQYNTRKEAMKAFYTECIIPNANLLFSQIDMGLKKYFANKDYYQVIDKSKIDALNPDKEEQVKNWLTMYEKGAISREKFLELTQMEDNGTTYNQQGAVGQVQES